MTSGDCIVLIVLGLVVALIILGMARDRKKGKHCNCGCSGCPHSSGCPSQQNQD